MGDVILTTHVRERALQRGCAIDAVDFTTLRDTGVTRDGLEIWTVKCPRTSGRMWAIFLTADGPLYRPPLRVTVVTVLDFDDVEAEVSAARARGGRPTAHWYRARARFPDLWAPRT